MSPLFDHISGSSNRACKLGSHNQPYGWVRLAATSCFIILCCHDFLWSQEIKPCKVPFSSPVISVAVSVEQDRVYAGSGSTISVFSLDLKKKHTIQTELEFVNDLRFAGNCLVAAGGNPAEHGMLEVYDLKTLKLIKRKIAHDDSILSLAVAGGNILTASADGSIQKLNLRTLKRSLKYLEHSRRPIVVRSINENELVASAGLDDTIRIWNSQTGATIRTLTHHQADVLDLSVKPSTDSLPLIASVSRDQTVRFWQPTIGRMVRFKKLDEVPSVCQWVKGTPLILVGTQSGNLLVVDSITLRAKRIASVGSKVFALELAGQNSQVILGTKNQLISQPLVLGPKIQSQ